MERVFGKGGNWVAAGVVAALLLPLLGVGLAVPFAVALAVSLAAFAGIALLTRPKALFEDMDLSRVGQGRIDLARKVLSEAVPQMERLSEAAREIRKPEVRKALIHLQETARTVIEGVEANPERLMSVQRFLTYYLPRAADVAENYGVLEQRRIPDLERTRAAEEMVVKLDNAFSHYADSLLESDLSGLDVELRLLSASLDADLGKRP